MIRRGRVAALLGLLLLLMLAQASAAQKDTTRTESGAVTGKILSVDTSGKMLTIQEDGGDRWTFTTNADTSYKNGDTAIGLADLKSGWTVVVNYDASRSGNLALLVEVLDAS